MDHTLALIGAFFPEIAFGFGTFVLEFTNPAALDPSSISGPQAVGFELFGDFGSPFATSTSTLDLLLDSTYSSFGIQGYEPSGGGMAGFGDPLLASDARVTVNAVREPATLTLTGLGLVAAVRRARRKR